MHPRAQVSTSPARLARAAAAAAALVGAAACSRARRTPDDTLVVLFEAPPTSADPRYELTNYDAKLGGLVTAGLMTVNTPDMAPAPLLAERLDRVDPLTYDAVLRDGLRFSDGAPVTAADVAWTFMSVVKPDSDSPEHRQLADRFTSVEAIDARRVRFHLVAPLATLGSDLAFGVLERAAADRDGHFPGGRAVAAGPYVVDAIDDRGARLHANPYWSGPAPAVPKLEIRVVRDASARVLMLVGGSADLVQNGVRLDVVDDIADQPRVKVERGPSALLTYLMMNNDDPILREPRVRQAIALALDREAIVRVKLGGRAVLATGLLPPGHWAYEPDVPRWPHDLARARALLDAAGWLDPDGDGPLPRRRADGTPLHLTYKTSSDAFRLALAHVIAAQLGDVGIEVDVAPFEFATFFAQVKQGAYQLASMQTTDISEPDFYYTYFHSSRIPGPGHMDDGNRWRYRNARVDALAELGRRQLERADRRATYGEIQKILAADLPIIPLWHEDNVVVENRAISGFRILPNARLIGLVGAHKAP